MYTAVPRESITMMKIWVGAVMIILVIIAVDITVIGWDRFVSGIGAFVDGYWHAEHLTKQPADIKNTPTDRGQTPKQPTQSLRGALPWPGEQAEHQAPRVGTPVAGQPEAWWRIKYG